MINLVPQVPLRVIFSTEQECKDAVTHFLNKTGWCVTQTNYPSQFPASATLTYDFKIEELRVVYK